MEVVLGFVVFLAGLFFGGLAIIALFAKAGLNKQNVDWLSRMEMAKRRRLPPEEQERLVREIAVAMQQAAEEKYPHRARHHA